MPAEPARNQGAYLWDMLESARIIRGYVDGVNYDQFWDDSQLRDAVAMRIATIGEAARHITAETEAKLPSIPFHRIRGMRNRITHDYGKVKFTEVWSGTQEHIEPLIFAHEEHFTKNPPPAAP